MRTSAALALLAAVGSAVSIAGAGPRETFSFAGPFSLPGGPTGNPSITAAFTGTDAAGAYVAKRLVISGTVNTVLNDLAFSGYSVRVTPPAGAPLTAQLATDVAFFDAPASEPFRGSITIPAAQSVAGNWVITLIDNDDDGAGEDSNLTNVTLTFDDGLVVADQTINPVPDGVTTGTVLVDPTEVRWVRLTTMQAAIRSNFTYLELFTTSGGDTQIALFSTAGNLIAEDDESLDNGLSLLTFGTGSGIGTFDGFNGPLPAGTYWFALARYFTSFGQTDFAADSGSPESGNIGFTIRQGSQNTEPPVSEPFGTFGTTTPGVIGVVTRTYEVTSGNDVKWFSFDVVQDVSFDGVFYLDIDTEGTAPNTGPVEGNLADTEIALYGDFGLGISSTLVADDDDGGSDFRSLLTFGNIAQGRLLAPTPGSVFDSGRGRNGIDGDLPVGTYYLAVATFNAQFGDGFGVAPPTNRANVTGERVVNFRSNLPRGPVCDNPSNVSGPGQNTATIDAELTADDIIVFLNRFFAGNPLSNVSGPGQNTVTLDNELTADDIIVFLNRFFAGC